jgi:hypothetical protein
VAGPAFRITEKTRAQVRDLLLEATADVSKLMIADRGP